MKILIIDALESFVAESLLAQGFEVHYMPEIAQREVYTAISDTDILILNSKVNVDKSLIEHAPKLRLAIRAGVGMDHFDLPYLQEKGVLARNTAGANADSVAEHAMGMLLALQHNLVRSHAQVSQFQWIREANRGIEIGGKTVGIIGYGNTGSAFARKLAGFGTKILAYDKYKQNFGTDAVKEASLTEIFAEADILSLHIPLTSETKHWIKQDFFHQFQKTITFLNLSRGPILVLEDLLSALDSGKVRAAGLDVLENEKFETLNEKQKADYTNLFARDNVILSPHIGGWSVESKRKIGEEILKIVGELV